MKQSAFIAFKIYVHIVYLIVMFIISTILLDYISIKLSFLALFKRCPCLILYEVLVLFLITSIAITISILVAFRLPKLLTDYLTPLVGWLVTIIIVGKRRLGCLMITAMIVMLVFLIL